MLQTLKVLMGRCGHDLIVVGFTTTCAISVYHHLWVWILLMARCTRYNIMWKSLSALPQVSGFLCVLLFTPPTSLWFSPGTLISSTKKTDCHDITEILLKVSCSGFKHPNPNPPPFECIERKLQFPSLNTSNYYKN